MQKRTVATVFGGSGFLGRYLVRRLADQGYTVRVAVRDPEGALFLKPLGFIGQIVPLYADLGRDDTIARAVEEATLVVNLVGILAERRKGDFTRIHVRGAGAIAAAAAAAGVACLVHVSAIGADPAARSRYAASKGEGENAVGAAYPAATILRPSIVFGPEDKFFNRFGAMAQLLPFMPVIAGRTRMQPVYVADVADAVMAVIGSAEAAGKIYELGGPAVFTFRELLAYVLKETGRPRPLVPIPMALARLQARFAELLPNKPITRDQLLLLARDNVVAPDAPGLGTLGLIATPIERVVPSYLRMFRIGGGWREQQMT